MTVNKRKDLVKDLLLNCGEHLGIRLINDNVHRLPVFYPNSSFNSEKSVCVQIPSPSALNQDSSVYKLRANVPDLDLDRHGLALNERLAHERAAGNEKAVAVLVPLERLLSRRDLLLTHSGGKHKRAGAKNKQGARHWESQKKKGNKNKREGEINHSRKNSLKKTVLSLIDFSRFLFSRILLLFLS